MITESMITAAPISCASIYASDIATISIGSCGNSYNLYETVDGYEVELPLPGISFDEVRVFYDHNELRIVVHPKDDGVDRSNKMIKAGFYKGGGEYTIKLVCCESVDAEMKDGVLYIHAPKKVKGVEVTVRNA